MNEIAISEKCKWLAGKALDSLKAMVKEQLSNKQTRGCSQSTLTDLMIFLTPPSIPLGRPFIY